MPKAFFLKQFGNPENAFSLQEIVLPELKSGQALINVEAFGLNFADVMARRGKYRDAPPLPFVPGYDVVGTVVSVKDEDNGMLLGKRVAGFCRFGGYSQQVITHVDALIEIKDMNAEDALSLCTQGVTASYMAALIDASNQGRFALVHAAAGGVGSLLIQLLKLKGIKIIAKVGSEEKSKAIELLNPEQIIVSNSMEYSVLVSEIIKNEGLVASFNALGGASIKNDLKLLGAGGNLVLFGGASLLKSKYGFLSLLNFAWSTGFYSPIPFMMQSKSITGVNMLKIADERPEILKHHLKICFDLYIQDKLKPIRAKRFSEQEISSAHALLESGKSTGKVVVYWGDLG